MAAVIAWSGVAFILFGKPGDRDMINQLKGADFVQVYTLAHSAFEGPYPTLDNRDAFYERQVGLVPASRGDVYLPVYPPPAALIFYPFTVLPYRAAALLWAAITIVGYVVVTWRSWHPVRHLLPDRRFLVAAAAAFPPFFLLVLYGQTTLLPLLAFFLAWLALRGGRPVLAGLALGLLSIKPQFAPVVALVLLAGLNGRVLLGLAASAVVQVTAVVWTMGTQAFMAYLSTLKTLSTVEHLVEPDAWRMHSLRTLTRLMPGTAGDVMWAAASVVVVGLAVRAWRSAAPLHARFGIVVLATVLVNPHLFAYDAVVLVLPFIWLGGWLEAVASPVRHSYWQAVYATSALLLFPTALIIHVQGSVIVLSWIFWRTAQDVIASGERQPQGRAETMTSSH